MVADPTFEAILYHAKLNGAEVAKVPLTSSFAHDLPKMLAAAKKGVVYICNPNNPTASITPAKEMRDFIAHAPNDTMILVDEAYHHYADSPEYESMIPLVKDHRNLIVARTFSKIYGMAGLRCGYCVAQSYTVERLRERQSWDSINIMALAAAGASLQDPEQVTKGRALNAETRAFTIGELEKMGYQSIPSQANFIMVDLKRPVVPIIQIAQTAQDPGRPIISRHAESSSPNDREKGGDGSVPRGLPPGHGSGLTISLTNPKFRRRGDAGRRGAVRSALSRRCNAVVHGRLRPRAAPAPDRASGPGGGNFPQFRSPPRRGAGSFPWRWRRLHGEEDRARPGRNGFRAEAGCSPRWPASWDASDELWKVGEEVAFALLR